jgi:hypothetical protein
VDEAHSAAAHRAADEAVTAIEADAVTTEASSAADVEAVEAVLPEAPVVVTSLNGVKKNVTSPLLDLHRRRTALHFFCYGWRALLHCTPLPGFFGFFLEN